VFGLGVALVTTRTARLFPGRARLISLATPPKPLCIAAGYRVTRADDKPLGVFVEELRKAAQTFAPSALHRSHESGRSPMSAH
jgi:hypothetical protein